MDSFLPLLLVFGCMMIAFGSARTAELKRDNARINYKLDLLLKHLGIEIPAPGEPGFVPPDLLPQIKDLIEQRRKVQAIKLLRDRTGLGLYEAKNTIDSLERKL